METSIINLPQLADKLPKYFTVSVASKRNSGKSFLISKLVRHLINTGRVQMVLVMSGSAGLNNDYGFLPKKLVQPFNEASLAKLWELQRFTPETKRKHILIVLDDCLSTKEAITSPTIQSIFTLGRHLWISCIVMSQVSNWLLSPVLKANSDIILWSKLNRQQLDTLWSSTAGMSKEDFLKFSEQGGHNYQFCGLDNYTKSALPSDCLFVVRA